MHIDKDEQERRFRERQENPEKQWKITDEDWRNREKWEQYEDAVNEMLMRTSTDCAPWVVVEGNDKYYARVKVLQDSRGGHRSAPERRVITRILQDVPCKRRREMAMTIREQLEERELEYLRSMRGLEREFEGQDEGRTAVRHPACIPERPGPDPALQGVPPPEAEDAGISPPQRGSLPDTADPYPGGVPERQDHRESALRLNEDLVEAIALGHDLGHTPFGHAGERALNTVYHFSHHTGRACGWWTVLRRTEEG